MNKQKYHVWINDDMESELNVAQLYLNREFPGNLEIRTHKYYYDLRRTIRAWKDQPNHESELIKIHIPGLIIQDYNYGDTPDAHEIGLKSLELITENFPSAKIIVTTSKEYYTEARKMIQEHGWDFPVTGKFGYDRDTRSMIYDIIREGLSQKY